MVVTNVLIELHEENIIVLLGPSVHLQVVHGCHLHFCTQSDVESIWKDFNQRRTVAR